MKRGPGRPKGSVNKVTASVKEAIEHAASEIGGAARLAQWAKEAPENEKTFWSSIYPKLLPLQVTGKDGDALKVEAAIALRPTLTREEWLKAYVDSTEGATTSGD